MNSVCGTFIRVHTHTQTCVCLIHTVVCLIQMSPSLSASGKWGTFSSVINRNRSDGLDPFYTYLFQALTTQLFMGAARRGTHRAGAVRAGTLDSQLAELVGGPCHPAAPCLAPR